MKNTSFVIMGRPGSGKSVQAKLLAEKTGNVFFSPGNVYRELLKKDTLLGRKLKNIVESGELGPHWLSSFMFQSVLFDLKDSEGFVFEGVGRKEEEAKLLHEIMEWLNRDYVVFDVDVNEEEITKRIRLRREKENREDDGEEDILVRLKEYKEYTEPSIKFFESVGKLVRINGDQSVEDVHSEIMKHLDL